MSSIRGAKSIAKTIKRHTPAKPIERMDEQRATEKRDVQVRGVNGNSESKMDRVVGYVSEDRGRSGFVWRRYHCGLPLSGGRACSSPSWEFRYLELPCDFFVFFFRERLANGSILSTKAVVDMAQVLVRRAPGRLSERSYPHLRTNVRPGTFSPPSKKRNSHSRAAVNDGCDADINGPERVRRARPNGLPVRDGECTREGNGEICTENVVHLSEYRLEVHADTKTLTNTGRVHRRAVRRDRPPSAGHSDTNISLSRRTRAANVARGIIFVRKPADGTSRLAISPNNHNFMEVSSCYFTRCRKYLALKIDGGVLGRSIQAPRPLENLTDR